MRKREQVLQSYRSKWCYEIQYPHWQICNPTLTITRLRSAGPRIWTCDTRPFLLAWAGWGLGTRLLQGVVILRTFTSGGVNLRILIFIDHCCRVFYSIFTLNFHGWSQPWNYFNSEIFLIYGIWCNLAQSNLVKLMVLSAQFSGLFWELHLWTILGSLHWVNWC